MVTVSKETTNIPYIQKVRCRSFSNNSCRWALENSWLAFANVKNGQTKSEIRLWAHGFRFHCALLGRFPSTKARGKKNIYIELCPFALGHSSNYSVLVVWLFRTWQSICLEYLNMARHMSVRFLSFSLQAKSQRFHLKLYCQHAPFFEQHLAGQLISNV